MRSVAAVAVALLAILLLAPAPASALDPAPPAGAAPYGTVVVLKDRRAGFFEDVRKVSREVSYVRDGVERPLTPGFALYEGDAIRTADGTAVVETPAGWRVEVGERSQVRLERSVLQRLGEVFYKVSGAFSVKVDDVELLVEGTAFKVTRDLPGNGELLVAEGGVRYRIPAIPGEKVAAGHELSFTQTSPGELRSVTADDLAALAAWRAARFEPGGAVGWRRNRVQLRIGGGLTFFDGLKGWGRGGITARVRAYGPLWVGGGVDLMGRRADEVLGAPVLLGLPAHVGARFVADLPRAFFVSGGIDFTLLVGGRCADQTDCERVTTAEPGGRLTIAGGLRLTPLLALDVEFSGGVARFLLPPVTADEAPVAVVEPQLHLTLGLSFRFGGDGGG